MKLTLAALCAALCASAWADRAIASPSGAVVRKGHLAVSQISAPNLRDESIWFGYGAAIGWEVGVETRGLRASDLTVGVDAAYNFTASIVDLTPGLTVGVQDIAGEMPEGRRFYFAAYWDIGNIGRYNQDIPTRLTMGMTSRDGGRWFGSVHLPFTSCFALTAEHDGFEPAASLDITPVKGLSFRTIFREKRTLWGAQARLAF